MVATTWDIFRLDVNYFPTGSHVWTLGGQQVALRWGCGTLRDGAWLPEVGHRDLKLVASSYSLPGLCLLFWQDVRMGGFPAAPPCCHGVTCDWPFITTVTASEWKSAPSRSFLVTTTGEVTHRTGLCSHLWLGENRADVLFDDSSACLAHTWLSLDSSGLYYSVY